MVTKALLIGAKPVPTEGPWVPLREKGWVFQPEPVHVGRVRIDCEDGALLPLEVRSTEPIKLRGTKVRAVVLQELPGLETLSLNIRWLGV